MKKLHLLTEYLADPRGMRLFNYVRELFANSKDYSTIDELGRSIVKELGLIVEACPSSMELVRPAATFASKHCGEVALIVGESGAAFNWFKSTIRSDITINSLSNEEITIEPMRFVELLCQSPSEFLSWVEHIFYYSGRYGGLVEELKHIDDSVVRAIQSYSEFTPKVDIVEVLKSLRGLAYYATQYDRPSQELIAELVIEIRNLNKPCTYPWCFASLLLSQGLGQHVGDSSKFASDCLKNCVETLHPMELMQAVPPVISDDVDIEKHAELIIKGLEVPLSQASEDGVTMRANQSRIFPALYPAMKQLALNRRTDLALNVLGAWANGNGVQDSLFIMPYCEEGVFAFDNAGIQHKMIDQHGENIERLTSRFNTFANLCISLRTANSTLKASPNEDRRGAPSPAHNDDLIGLLEKVYCFSDLDISDAQRMIVAPATQHPLQAMMLSARGETLPLSSSFQRPAEDRTIRKAIILVDDSAYSHLERESLVSVLESNRIEYTIVEGGNRTADELLESIELENPDLLWFIGHGEFDHYAAHKSAIISSIRLEWWHFERLRGNSNNGRRLVILNICSGGAPATDESPANTGIGPIIASPNNAVIGHLWDINTLVGATFGALLALELGKQISFFDAFCGAVTTLTKSRKDIESIIRSAGLSELADRVTNSDSIPFEDIASWGSPVFWE